ncbi:MAG: hypothetical protein M3Q49_06430 [Actinomycetota bacterium]|nr:hypothetical protein [Actinomycetota bacterium]
MEDVGIETVSLVSFEASLTVTETNGRVLPDPSGPIISDELLKRHRTGLRSGDHQDLR